MAMDKELMAPSVSPISSAFEVPMACAEEPSPMPSAIGFFLYKILYIISAVTFPKNGGSNSRYTSDFL